MDPANPRLLALAAYRFAVLSYFTRACMPPGLARKEACCRQVERPCLPIPSCPSLLLAQSMLLNAVEESLLFYLGIQIRNSWHLPKVQLQIGKVTLPAGLD